MFDCGFSIEKKNLNLSKKQIFSCFEHAGLRTWSTVWLHKNHVWKLQPNLVRNTSRPSQCYTITFIRGKKNNHRGPWLYTAILWYWLLFIQWWAAFLGLGLGLQEALWWSSDITRRNTNENILFIILLDLPGTPYMFEQFVGFGMEMEASQRETTPICTLIILNHWEETEFFVTEFVPFNVTFLCCDFSDLEGSRSLFPDVNLINVYFLLSD